VSDKLNSFAADLEISARINFDKLKFVGQVCRTSLSDKFVGQVCRTSLSDKFVGHAGVGRREFFMRSSIRLSLVLLIAIVLIAPIISQTHAAQSPPRPPPQAFEPLVSRIRETLTLNDQQVSELRTVLIAHGPKLFELRNRAQANPYAPGLQTELDKEQKAIRDELSAYLDEDQKGKLANVDTRQLVPLGPAFLVINIAPRNRIEASTQLATSERLIAAPPAVGLKARGAKLTDDQRILHLLNRIAFGPRPGDIDRIKLAGADRFIEEQLHPEAIDDSDLEKRLEVLPTQRLASAELYQFYPPQQVAEQRATEKNAPPVFGRPPQIIGELVQQKLVRAVSSNRQLQEVLTDFWYNHFNVFAQKEADQWLVTSYEREAIRPHALGKFRDLLLATAQNPAMLFYLDNWLSSAPDSKQPRPPRPPLPQNTRSPKPAPGASSTPRAVPTMAASGTEQDPAIAPRKDGPVTNPQSAIRNPRSSGAEQDPAMAPRMDGASTNPQSAIRNPQSDGKPPAPKPPPPRKPGINENYARELLELHTLGVDGGYTQKDVQEVARCFTGWTIDRPFQGGGFVFRPWMHDDGPKTVLGVTIPAGGGVNDGLRLIEILSRHPSTARFISKKLCQRFVSDDPPAQLVDRIAQVFMKTDGDIREVIRAIVNSPEFNSPTFFRSKVKSPLELAASAIRAVDADTNGAPALHDWIRRMGEPLYQFAFPTGYGEDSAKWVNTGVFFNRINFAVALANNQINGTRFDPARLVTNEIAANPDRLTNQLAGLVLHTELSPSSLRAVRAGLADQSSVNATRSTQPAMNSEQRPAPVPVASTPANNSSSERRRIAQVIGLLMGTTEFQRK
jgi:uncharacterized protein (DUF1800 family)